MRIQLQMMPLAWDDAPFTISYGRNRTQILARRERRDWSNILRFQWWDDVVWTYRWFNDFRSPQQIERDESVIAVGHTLRKSWLSPVTEWLLVPLDAPPRLAAEFAFWRKPRGFYLRSVRLGTMAFASSKCYTITIICRRKWPVLVPAAVAMVAGANYSYTPGILA